MEALAAAAERVVRSGRYINGPEVDALEERLCRLHGVDYCVAVSNGLDALRLILLAYKQLGKLSDGDEVIVPANTFIATFLAVTGCGLVAVPADVDESTFCLDFNNLPVSMRTRAIITVHLYGNPCWNRKKIEELHAQGLLIIEDDAQAIGALSAEEGLRGNRRTGALADAAAISFYPAKNVGALGDAGAVLTPHSDLAAMVRKIANYGSSGKYRHEVCGFNCRMDELQAALLREKLPRLEEVALRRREAAMAYDRAISNPSVVKPRIFSDGASQAWHQYVIRHPRRDSLRAYLADNGVGTEIHYPVPCHLQPCYQGHHLMKTYTPLPVAERLADEVLSLPIADVSLDQIEFIANLINAYAD